MKRFVLPIFLVLVLILAACASPEVATQPAPAAAESIVDPLPTPTDDAALIPTLFPNAAVNEEMTRIDEQGAVIVQVTPLNVGTPADTLEFDISLSTHSVDLTMDLAGLSTLTTDTGVSIQPTIWDAPRGGHHVQGKLIFPAMQDGKSILEGASKLTLTITDVDAPARVFEWELK